MREKPAKVQNRATATHLATGTSDGAILQKQRYYTAIDANTITVFLSQNSETIQKYVKLMFEDCKRDIKKIRNESNELRTENKELQKNIEF